MKTVLLLLAQGFEEFEASVFTYVLGWSRSVGEIPVNVVTAGLRPKIECTWNLIVLPQIQAHDVHIDEYDALAIPGGFEEAGFYEDAFHEDFLNLIRAFDAAGKIVASICVGALPVGRSGILQGRNATTYHLNDGMRRKQLQAFGVNVLNEQIVVDKNVMTSTAPSTALDVAFTLLEMLTTPENCRIVKEAMGFTV